MSTQYVSSYISDIKQTYQHKNATEHSYRSAIEGLFQGFAGNITALNEPGQVDCGEPDFAVLKDKVTIGYVETKKPQTSLSSLSKIELNQQLRYLKALPNLIYTNYLDWEFYQQEECIGEVSIASIQNGKIHSTPASFPELNTMLRTFIYNKPIRISDPDELAKWLAGKTHIIKEAVMKLLNDKKDPSGLIAQFNEFKKYLIDDIKKEDFSDIYAETVTYGLFTARLHYEGKGEFKRSSAASFIPSSNPFLKQLFVFLQNVPHVGISWIVDDLIDVLRECEIEKMMKGFEKVSGREDPFLYFYESFLQQYDPEKRVDCGVYYTPKPVVRYIVRSVDEVLRKEFSLIDGLADTTKIPSKNIPDESINYHGVQILDPAAGTGTFLAEAVTSIMNEIKTNTPTMVQSYVDDNLIPRLHGFELLMAPYAMCHLKLDLTLEELGYKQHEETPRLSVYLTNSLEEGEDETAKLGFGAWLSDEAKGANIIKRELPLMCVIGNPPYKREAGAAKGWIGKLLDDYKKEPGSSKPLQEQNKKEINDLYVRFIRLSSHFIEKNRSGVLGFVTNHGYIDNKTFRGMRWHLLNTFDKIWILDLNGNNRVVTKSEKDENVFDILQGVAIIIAVKKQDQENELAEIYHHEIIGKRKKKYGILDDKSKLKLSDFKKITPIAPYYYFKDVISNETYSENGFSLDELMRKKSVGINTGRDEFLLDESGRALIERLKEFKDMDCELAREKYDLGADSRDWAVKDAQNDIVDFDVKCISTLGYRPFDPRCMYYTKVTGGILMNPRSNIMRHYKNKTQIGILYCRGVKTQNFSHVFITETPSEQGFLGGATRNAPLYLFEKENSLFESKIVNFNDEIFREFREFARHPEYGIPNELDILDYIYGVLHSSVFREKYNDDLKMDFPRVPYPSSAKQFWNIQNKGEELRNLHLMKPEAIGPLSIPLKGTGNNVVEKYEFKNDRIFINDSQFFEGVPERVANFYIGSYCPAQKWLKDRKKRELNHDEVQHYQRILTILMKTCQIMDTIEISF